MSFDYKFNDDNNSIKSFKTYTSYSNQSIIFNNTNKVKTKLNTQNVYFNHLNYKDKAKVDTEDIKTDIKNLLISTSDESKLNSTDIKTSKKQINKSKPVVPVKSNKEIQDTHDIMIFLTNGKLLYSTEIDLHSKENSESDISLEISVLSLLLETLDYNIMNIEHKKNTVLFYYNHITPNVKIVYRLNTRNKKNISILKQLDEYVMSSILNYQTIQKQLLKFEGLDLRYSLDYIKLDKINQFILRS